jgi:uncharacterized protein (DUF1697 family)
MKYVTFLRGINGLIDNRISMDELKKIHLNFGCENIKTVLNSGNVIFEIDKKNKKDILILQEKISNEVSNFLKRKIDILIIKYSVLEKIIVKKPFDNISENNHKYISFIYGKQNQSQNEFKEILPKILAIDLVKSKKETIKMMTALDKYYDKKVTTRN